MAPKSSKNNPYVTVYEPNHIQKAGIRVWGEMFQELIAFRGLIWRLIVRDISAKYKQSFLGIFWAFLTPLVMMVVFVWIKNKNILPIEDKTPGPRWNQPQQHPPQCGFSATAFAHQPQSPTGLNTKTHTIHCFYYTVISIV